MIRIILIVDDPNSARDIQNQLQRVSYDVTAMTATADEVITRADELRPDVILMDVRLKGETDGVEVAQQIKSLHDIPIIFITANTDEATVRRAIAAEPDGFLIMPLDELELRAAIEMAIHRHGMEAKARESDRRIRELTESLSVVIFETDMAGNITFVNHAGLKEFGYTKEQVEGGMTLYDLIPPDKQEEIRESIAQAVIDEPSEWIEVPGLRRDGSTFPVSVRASLIVREGVPVGIRGIALNVTEQKRAEQQREDSERQLRELTDALPEIVFETDVGGTFTFLNPMGLDSLGYTDADLKKQLTIEDLIIPADHARARENFRKRLGGTAAVWTEYTVQRKDGSTFPLSIRTTAVIRDGVVVGARGIAIDITEQKRAEEALREQDEMLRFILNASEDAIFLADTAGVVLTANEGLAHRFGVKSDELVDLSIFAHAPDDVAEKRRALFEQAIATRVPVRWEDERDGRYLESGFYPIVTAQGEITKVAMFSRDVTERARAAQKLQESERRIRELTDSLPVVVYETDATGRITFVNATASDMFGYTKEEIEAGMSIFQMVTDADKELALTSHRRRLSGEDMGRVEYTALRKDGSTCPISVRAVSIRRHSEVVGVRGIVVDIAERKQAEERVKEHTHTIEIFNQIVTEGNRADSVESFAKTVTNLTLELIHFDAGTIHLIDDDACCAKLRYATGIPDTAVEAIRKIPLDETPYARFLVEPKPLFVDGHEASRVPHVAAFGLESLAVVPLYRYDKIIGALNVGSFKRHAFSQAEKELLIAIGNEVGVVIAKLHADEALKESEKRIREVTDALPVVVYETDETGRFTFVNATAFDVFSYTKEEIEAGMSIFQMIAPTDRERARTVFHRRVGGEDVGRIEYTGLRKDGGMFPILVRAVQMRRDGAVLGLRGVIVDFTEQKQTEQALARESAINSAIARLFTPLIAPTSTLEDIALAILDEAKHLTGSEAGFVGLIDPANSDMVGFGLTQMMPEECAIPEEKRQIRFPIGLDGSYPALWGRALNAKKGFYTNAPATHPASRGTPDGHTPLAQLLAVPALVGDHVEGEIMLANPARDYTERDLTAVERLAGVYALAVIRTQKEDAIRSAFEEKETLLKEIHHRVKNNMQIISSFLNLQATQAKEPETVDMLNESQSRIRSMALIHEQLYRSSSLADIDFAEYVESLTNALLRMYNVAEGEIAITTDIENVQLGVDTAIPCALIVNELVSNCLKHAFIDRKTGEVTIAIHRINGTYELMVADNGVGFPPDLDIRETNTLGLQLVIGLVNQLDGTITLNRMKGTTFIITFKPEGARVVKSRGK